MLRGSFEISCQACSSSSKTLASFKSPLSGLVSALPAESMRIDSLPTRPLGIPLQHPVYARARPPAAQHGGSPQIVCIPVSSLHALVTKALALARQVFCDIACRACRNNRLSRVLAGRGYDHAAILLQAPADRAVGGGTRRPICFAAVAAQRGIGRFEGKWCAPTLTPRIKRVIASSFSAGRRSASELRSCLLSLLLF